MFVSFLVCFLKKFFKEYHFFNGETGEEFFLLLF